MRPESAGISSPVPKRIKLEPSPSPDREVQRQSSQHESLEDNCSICLQSIADRTVVPGCSHEFCFECLIIWSDQSRRCPLCSQQIGEYLIHHIRSKYDYQKHYLPPLRSSPIPLQRTALDSATNASNTRRRGRRAERVWGRRERQQLEEADRLDRAIARRRWIYEHDLYAKHVASNTYTRYRPYPTPAQFSASQEYISRTTAFLRRELRVWPNLDVEFLTTFVISLMKAIDIRSESAVKLLAEFLDMDSPYVEGGRFRNAEHFAHEIYSFVRSPFKDLFVYDSVAQYDVPSEVPPPPQQSTSRRWHTLRSRSVSRSPHSRSRSASRRLHTHTRRSRSRSRSNPRSRSVSWSPSGRSYPSTRQRLGQRSHREESLPHRESGPSRPPHVKGLHSDHPLHQLSQAMETAEFTPSWDASNVGVHDNSTRAYSAADGKGKGKGKGQSQNGPVNEWKEVPEDHEDGTETFCADAYQSSSKKRDIATLLSQEAVTEASSCALYNDAATVAVVSDDLRHQRSKVSTEKTAPIGRIIIDPSISLTTTSKSNTPQTDRGNGRSHRTPRNRSLLESVQAHLATNAGSASRLDKRVSGSKATNAGINHQNLLRPSISSPPSPITGKPSLLARLSDSQQSDGDQAHLSPDTSKPAHDTTPPSMQSITHPSLRSLSDGSTRSNILSTPSERNLPQSGRLSASEIMTRTRARLAKLDNSAQSPSNEPVASHSSPQASGISLPPSKAKPPSPSCNIVRPPTEGRSDHNDNPNCEFSARFGNPRNSLGENHLTVGSTSGRMELEPTMAVRCITESSDESSSSSREKLLSKLAEEKRRISSGASQEAFTAPTLVDRSSLIAMRDDRNTDANILTHNGTERPRGDSQVIEAMLRSRARLKLRLAAAKQDIQHGVSFTGKSRTNAQ